MAVTHDLAAARRARLRATRSCTGCGRLVADYVDTGRDDEPTCSIACARLSTDRLYRAGAIPKGAIVYDGRIVR